MLPARRREPRQDHSQTSTQVARRDGGLMDPHFNRILIFGRPLFPRSVVRQQNISAGTRTRRRSTRPPSSRASRQLFSGIGASNVAMDELDFDQPRGMDQGVPLRNFLGQVDPTASGEDYRYEPPRYTEVPPPQRQEDRQSTQQYERPQRRHQHRRSQQGHTRRGRHDGHRQRRASPPDPGFTYISDPSSSSSGSSPTCSSEGQESLRMRKRDRIAAKVYGVLGLRRTSSSMEEEDGLETSSEEYLDEQVWEDTTSIDSLEDLMTPAPAQIQTHRIANARNDNRPNAQDCSVTTTRQSSFVNSFSGSIFPDVGVYLNNSDTSSPSTSGTTGHQCGGPTSSGSATTPQRASRGRTQQQRQQRHHQQPQSRQSYQEQHPQAQHRRRRQNSAPRRQPQPQPEHEQEQQRLRELRHQLQRELPPLPEPHAHSQTWLPLQRQPHMQLEPLPVQRAETTNCSDGGGQDAALANNVVADDNNIQKEQGEENNEAVATNNTGQGDAVADGSVRNDKADEAETPKEWNTGQIGILVVLPAVMAFVASRLQQA